jgi:hypothetical protein
MWTHSACRPLAVLAGNAIGTASRLSIRPFRTGRADWSPPLPDHEWEEWLASAGRLVDTDVASVVVLPPGDVHRRRFSLILLDGKNRPVGFVKWTRNPPNPLAVAAERILGDAPLRHFSVPRLLAHQATNGWTCSINEMLPPGPHRPARLDSGTRQLIVAEIHRHLTGLATGPWPISHGDFAPWNVRRLSTGTVAVIDWEDVRPAPVATDELWHVVTATLSTGGSAADAIGRVESELTHHDSGALAAAATFLRRREIEQPREADATIRRSAALLAFERAISEALAGVQGASAPD